MKKAVKKKDTNLKMQSPWVTYYNKVNALFGKDPDIKVELKDDHDSSIKEIILYVNDEVKANAINLLLKNDINMGNLTLKVYAVCPNTDNDAKSALNTIETAFKNNPIFKNTINVDTVIGNVSYAVFAKEVVQFFNDDLTDAWGNYNGLPEDIAREILDVDKPLLSRINICTDGEA